MIADLDDPTKEIDDPFEAAGISIQPLRLFHGGTYISLGFLFGGPG